ncbi:hypothetical protein ONZ45_g11951 [Pleurotus djamor]|nr:hypothetical protein ONZ45_g11951 [Pleurotus djamor]
MLYAPSISPSTTDEQRALDVMERGSATPMPSFGQAFDMLNKGNSDSQSTPNIMNKSRATSSLPSDERETTSSKLLGTFGGILSSATHAFRWPRISSLEPLVRQPILPPPCSSTPSQSKAQFRHQGLNSILQYRTPPVTESISLVTPEGIPADGTVVLPGTHATPSICVRQPTQRDENAEFQLLLEASGEWLKTLPENTRFEGRRPQEDHRSLTAYTLVYEYPDPRHEGEPKWLIEARRRAWLKANQWPGSYSQPMRVARRSKTTRSASVKSASKRA